MKLVAVTFGYLYGVKVLYLLNGKADHELFTQLFVQNFSDVLRMCHARFGYKQKELAYDCAQEVFVELFNCLAKLENHPNLEGWIFLTAHNIIKQYIRVITNESKRFQDVQLDTLLAPDTIESLLESNIDVDKMKQYLLSTLNEAERQLYNYFYVDKIGIKQISIKSNQTEATIRSRLFRLRRKIVRSVKIELEDQIS